MIYISIDVETDGPVPGLYSMRQLGAAAFSNSGKLRSTFSANLQQLRGAIEHENTMAWWLQHPKIWNEITKNAERPIQVISRFNEWLESFKDQLTAIAWPTSFDFPFVHYYLVRFTGDCILGHAAIDIKTMGAVVMNNYTRSCHKGELPEEYQPAKRHSHIAVEDAIEQGELFFILRKRLQERAE